MPRTRPIDSATRSFCGSRALRMKSALVCAGLAKTARDSHDGTAGDEEEHRSGEAQPER